MTELRPRQKEAIEWLIEDYRDQVIVMVDDKLQNWNGYDLYRDDTRAEEALAAVESFASIIMDELRKDARA